MSAGGGAYLGSALEELSRLYGGSVMLVPSQPGSSNYLYSVMVATSDGGPLVLRGFADIEQGEISSFLVFVDSNGGELKRIERHNCGSSSFDALVRLHVHHRRAISQWSGPETREWLSALLGAQHPLCFAGWNGLTLMRASQKELCRAGANRREIAHIYACINREISLLAEQLDMMKSSFSNPPKLPEELDESIGSSGSANTNAEYFKTVKRIANALTIRIDERAIKNITLRQDCLNVLLAAADEASVTDEFLICNSSLPLKDVLDVFSNEDDLTMTELDATSAMQQLDRLAGDREMENSDELDGIAEPLARSSLRPDPPAHAPTKPELPDHDQLVAIVVAQGRRIEQLETLVSTLMAQRTEEKNRKRLSRRSNK